jgi:hypothetical protein
MRLSVITRATVIAASAGLAGLGIAGVATGSVAHHAVRHPPSHRPAYHGSGHSSYDRTGQACFGATWQGTGAWNTSYLQTIPDPPNGDDVTNDKDSSGYSWDLGEHMTGAECALELLRVPHDKPVGGASWDRGFVRLQAKGDDVYTEAGEPPVTTQCSKARTERPGTTATGGMTIKTRGTSIIFVMNLFFPSVECGAYSAPGQSVSGGKVGNFLTSESVAVPRSVFEHDGTVSITISSDSTQGGRSNCGVHAPSPTTVTCSQNGAWQGTLTLRQ